MEIHLLYKWDAFLSFAPKLGMSLLPYKRPFVIFSSQYGVICAHKPMRIICDMSQPIPINQILALCQFWLKINCIFMTSMNLSVWVVIFYSKCRLLHPSLSIYENTDIWTENRNAFSPQPWSSGKTNKTGPTPIPKNWGLGI